MDRSFVGAIRRAFRNTAVIAAALGLGGSPLAAQSTGKIEGRVRDQAGAPIPNAQVTIIGSAFTAQTNPQGYYFINNVPSGTVAMRAAFIGYRAVRAEGIRVLGGQTITQDFALQSSTIELDPIVIQTTQPLVPRDEVTSKQRIDGSFTDKLPVDRLSQVLTLQPGVVADSAGSGINIRGGRADEAATYVDGMPITPGNRGSVGGSFAAGTEILIGTNSFEEASVTTGASSAEFGNAQSGIISIATRTGSNTAFSGNVGWETDEPFGKNMSTGFNRFQASVGGPLRILNGLSFFASGALDGERYSYGGFGAENFPTFMQAGLDTMVAVPSQIGSASADTTYIGVYNLAVARGRCEDFAGSSNPEIAANYGAECQGARNPRDARGNYSLQGKLNYSYGSGSRLSLLFLGSRQQQRGAFGAGGTTTNTNTSNIFGLRSSNRIYQVNWTQNLSKSTERALALDASLSYQQDRTVNSPFTPAGELASRNTFGGFLLGSLDMMFDLESFPLDSALFDNFRNNRLGTRRSPFDLENTDQYRASNQYRDDAFGLLGGAERGGPAGFMRLNRENRLIGKAAMDWQFDRYNRLKFGGEYTRYHTTYYAHSLVTQAFATGFDEKPIRYNGFLEDRLDLGDVVVVGGLRYDAYDTRASRPYALDTVQTNPTFGTYQPFPRISSYTDEDGMYTLDGQSVPLVAFVRDAKHTYLSPHIQVAFPVTEKTNFRLSYAHQVQAPDFGVLMQGLNTDLAITNTNTPYGADLDFARSITFEFGIRHAFSDDMVLDVAAYNKDKLSDPGFRLVSRRDPTRNNSVDLRELTAADFGNSRGLDLRLDRRIGSLFNGTIAYSYSSAKNTGTDPQTYLAFGSRVVNALSGGNQPPPQAVAPTADSRPHNLAGAMSVTFPGDWQEGSLAGTVLQNVGLFATFRYASGTAYTKCEALAGNESIVSGQVCANGGFLNGLNSARLPTFKQFDLKATKSFGLGGLDMTAYLDVRNVLNLKNILAVFVETDDVVSANERDLYVANTLTAFRDEAADNAILMGNDDIDLRFGGLSASGCGNYVSSQGDAAAPSCVYLIRAEERWGNGDGILSVAEQTRIADASLLSGGPGIFAARGINNFAGPGRRMRFGLEINF
jgi:hypothetical protein